MQNTMTHTILARVSTLTLFLLLFSPLCLARTPKSPATFEVTYKSLDDNVIEVRFSAKIEEGWHIYSINQPKYGPTSATVKVSEGKGAELVPPLSFEGKELKVYDEMFEMEVTYFENQVVFIQKVKVTDSPFLLSGYLEYGACNDVTCLPPTKVKFHLTAQAIK